MVGDYRDVAEVAFTSCVAKGACVLLTLSTMSLLIGLQWARSTGIQRPMPGLGWLRSMGRHSYEIYLTHMFVVFGGVAIFKSLGIGVRWGWAWYLPIVLLCWLLGVIVARYFSVPCDRALRRFLLRHENLSTTPHAESTATGVRSARAEST